MDHPEQEAYDAEYPAYGVLRRDARKYQSADGGEAYSDQGVFYPVDIDGNTGIGQVQD
jgi:hypothetical protein